MFILNEIETSNHTIQNDLYNFWSKNTLGSEYTLHQLSPYIGKLKSSIAKGLILNFTKENDIIYDPYCGASTIPLEGLAAGRNVIANDLNPYAFVLTKAKLYPLDNLQNFLTKIESYSLEADLKKKEIQLAEVPEWVKDFFHQDTLIEILSWTECLTNSEEWFLLSCLLGILHHQRPGFLSYPSSHSVPYLRSKKYPKEIFPELYKYRNVKERLIRKTIRAFKRIPIIDNNLYRKCTNFDSSRHIPDLQIDAIITSPPYMRRLDYARDNRLRLWFLNCNGFKELDKAISPTEGDFLSDIRQSLIRWKTCLTTTGKCIFILGDSYCKTYKLGLPETIEHIAINEAKGYKLIFKFRNLIPDKTRVRRNLKGNKYETIIVLERTLIDE